MASDLNRFVEKKLKKNISSVDLITSFRFMRFSTECIVELTDFREIFSFFEKNTIYQEVHRLIFSTEHVHSLLMVRCRSCNQFDRNAALNDK